MNFPSGCVNGSRSGVVAAGKRVGDRRLRAYVPSRYAIGMGLFQTTERSRILSLLPARAGNLLRDRDAVPQRRGYDGGASRGLRSPITSPT